MTVVARFIARLGEFKDIQRLFEVDAIYPANHLPHLIYRGG